MLCNGTRLVDENIVIIVEISQIVIVEPVESEVGILHGVAGHRLRLDGQAVGWAAAGKRKL